MHTMRPFLLGKFGERHAVKYLRKRGYVIVERNYRTPFGEIDIIAREGDVLAFVEVKTRSSRTFGLPQEAVDLRKRRQIIRTARAFLREQGEPSIFCRFDVLALEADRGGNVRRVQLIRGAFDVPVDS